MKAQNLDAYQWKNRIVVVSSPNASNADYIKQMNEFADSAEGLADRKMLLYEMVEDKYKITNYLSANNDTEWKNVNGQDQNNKKPVEAFKVQLIGLDGSVKLEQKDILTKKTLFNTIDSMPMRIREKRNKD